MPTAGALSISLGQSSERLEHQERGSAAVGRGSQLIREAVDQPSLATIRAPRVREHATCNSKQPRLGLPGKLTATSPRDLEGLRNGVIRERRVRAP